MSSESDSANDSMHDGYLKFLGGMASIAENSYSDYYDNEEYDDESDGCDESFEVQSNLPVNKRKRRLNEEDRVKRCRERNRIHARNSRERKKNQMDRLQKRLQELISEKMLLQSSQSESSVASILISLSGNSSDSNSKILDTDITSTEESSSSCTSSKDLTETNLNRLNSSENLSRLNFGDESGDEIDERERVLFNKDRSQCTSQELEMIRRERNRIHAKKTRLRKKRVLQEMEASIISLEEEVRILRKQRRNGSDFDDFKQQDNQQLFNRLKNSNKNFSIMETMKGFEALKYPNGFQKSKNLNFDINNFGDLSSTVANLTSLKDIKQSC